MKIKELGMEEQQRQHRLQILMPQKLYNQLLEDSKKESVIIGKNVSLASIARKALELYYQGK